MPLSKSDFILASSCAKKLVYKKAGYPISNDTNEYMQMLARGGYVVGLYAQLMYPEGIEVEGGTPEKTSNETRRLLSENENITLFEACFVAGEKVVRTDILVKKENELHIIEVKSVSHDSENDSSKQKRKLREYMLDLAFQTLVVQESHPGYTIRSSLFIPDTTKRTIIEGLGGWFHILTDRNENNETQEVPPQTHSRFKKPKVVLSFHDYKERDVLINALRNDCLLSIKQCNEEVARLMPDVREASELHLEILKNGI